MRIALLWSVALFVIWSELLAFDWQFLIENATFAVLMQVDVFLIVFFAAIIIINCCFLLGHQSSRQRNNSNTNLAFCFQRTYLQWFLWLSLSAVAYFNTIVELGISSLWYSEAIKRLLIKMKYLVLRALPRSQLLEKACLFLVFFKAPRRSSWLIQELGVRDIKGCYYYKIFWLFVTFCAHETISLILYITFWLSSEELFSTARFVDSVTNVLSELRITSTNYITYRVIF